MTRLPLLLAIVAGCAAEGLPLVGPVDAGVDAAATACPIAPETGGLCGSVVFDCSYVNAFCRCAGTWFCSPPLCATAHAGEPCTRPGASCFFGPENGLLCVGPEDRWVFCGGIPLCESATTGALCCGTPDGPCDNGGGACVCGADSHVRCDADGGGG